MKLLVSVRGPREAIAAALGGADIVDVEYPASALGTPYPLNLIAVRNALRRKRLGRILISTNIGEQQFNRSTACQAALGVATAGADIIKCGLAEFSLEAAVYQARSIVRTVKHFYPRKKVIPSVFVDTDLQRFFRPFQNGSELLGESGADGLLIDTFNKSIGKSLLDYCQIIQLKRLAAGCHRRKKQLWIAGSLTLDDLPSLWAAGVDVICVRGAACVQRDRGRFGEVKSEIVAALVATKP
jgi:hypothetical protein